MTGFIRGLFGKKKKDDAGSSDGDAPKRKGAYFLEPDDAKTFGDIDYMRKSKTIKRTFAKGEARVREISSMNDAEIGNSLAAPAQPQPPTTQSQPQAETETQSFKPSSDEQQRRSPDSNMDMFRNMAKDIRKR